ncbi:aldehyde dehydrogenase family protein [Kribbella sp. NPDC049227]|uniref:aldehyde dehydrogenase family protein n=1 Tax=Kribbella sp. NPDC049227 TaxID=3364113 RepID=UPI00371101F2
MTELAIDRLGADSQRLVHPPEVLVAGTWAAGDGTPVTAIDPYTEAILADVPTASIDQVHAAVAGARRAVTEGAWAHLGPGDRSRLLHRVVEVLDRNRLLLARIVTAETGSPITLSTMLQVDPMLEHLAWFADAAARGPHGGYEQGLPLRGNVSASVLIHEPVGVVAALTPYNAPLVTAAWKVGGALAAGCSAVLLPSPRSALTSLAWARLVCEADLPEGAFSFLVGEQHVGRALTESDGVDMVTFTGSNGVGREVMRQAAGTFKRVVLELGGKSPNILLPGTDVQAVAGPSTLRYARNAGQTCGATTRIFVPRADYDEFVQATRDFLPGVQVGDPWDPQTVVGPLITAEHRGRVEGYVDRAIRGGGIVDAGGGRPATKHGYFMNPALIGGVTNDAEIARDELFGPVGVVIPYDDVDSAVAMANDSDYGLNANVWGPPPQAVEVARRIRSGTVTVNGGNGGLRPDTPFGGYRQSGTGREAGEEGFQHFLETKQVQIALNPTGPVVAASVIDR